MAPEQAVADTVDHRTDLYAWGLLVYELLAGTHPFARHITPQALITAHLTEPPPQFKSDSVPPALAALVMQCLEKDPACRPASAAAVLASLDVVTTTPSSPTAASAASATAP